MTSAAYFHLLDSALLLGLAEVPILERFTFNFQDDNAPSHSVKEV